MDILMPEMDGVEATRAILERQPEARIVILTSAALGHRVFDRERQQDFAGVPAGGRMNDDPLAS